MNKLRRVKKSIAILSAAAVFACSVFFGKATVLADNYNYRVDQFTDEPYYDDNGNINNPDAKDTSRRRLIKNGEYYDLDIHAFVFPIGSGTAEITAGVADGMIVNYPVSIDIPTEVVATLYQNGNEYNYNGNTVRDRGEYTLIAKVEDREVTVFSFTIEVKEPVLSATIPCRPASALWMQRWTVRKQTGPEIPFRW